MQYKADVTVIPAVTQVNGLTITLNREEVQALFGLVGNIGGGCVGSRPSPTRKLVNDLYEAIDKSLPDTPCDNPFVGGEGGIKPYCPWLRGD